MENTNTHKVCSVRIEYMQIKQFEFLVPNKCVDENSKIDEDIQQDIRRQFEMKELTYDDCEGFEYHNLAEVSSGPTFTVEKDCGEDDLEMQCGLEVFE